MISKPRTLLWQLGLALMVVQAVAVLLLGWYAIATFRDFNREQIVRELSRTTPLLVQRYEPLLGGSDTANDRGAIDRLVKTDGAMTGLRITIVLADGTVIADSNADPARMENHRFRPEIDAALEDGQAWATRRGGTTDEPTTYFARRIERDGQPLAVIRAAMPVAAVSAGPARVVRLVATAAVVSLALTLLVIYFVSRQLSRAVSRLAEGATRFAAGDLAHRIAAPPRWGGGGASELARLAEALNEMAARLNEQMDMLRTQRAEQQAIHQSMTSGLIALDRNHRVISVNSAAEHLLGLNGETARGRLLQELTREPELNRFVAGALDSRTLLESGAAPPERGTQSPENWRLGTLEFRLRSGSRATVQAFSEPMRNAHDQPAGVLLFINDVTQLRRLESIRSDFAANVSHELRTPITNIKGYAETLLDIGLDDRDQARQFLEIIRRNTSRLAAIIEDLMALARLEQPNTRATLDRAPVRLRRVAEAAAAQFEDEARAKQITIAITVPPDLVVNANMQLLEQALSNLLSNAIRYSGAGTAVTIAAQAHASRKDPAIQGPSGIRHQASGTSASWLVPGASPAGVSDTHHLTPESSGEVELSVGDEGPGIAEEHLSRIFERFYRVDRARSRELGGTGLGLAIVKHIALVHGGRVTVESEVGRGSVFRIFLPGDRPQEKSLDGSAPRAQQFNVP